MLLIPIFFYLKSQRKYFKKYTMDDFKKNKCFIHVLIEDLPKPLNIFTTYLIVTTHFLLMRSLFSLF